eukprot:6876991-Prymnesium_polylepis.1
MFNYDSEANSDNGLCEPSLLGCTAVLALNFRPAANTDDGSCVTLGCMDSNDANFTTSATVHESSMCTSVGRRALSRRRLTGCPLPSAQNYDPTSTCYTGACYSSCTFAVYGCTDSLASNFDPTATAEFNPTSCNYARYGCMTQTDTFNYDSLATAQPEGACRVKVAGCTDSLSDTFSSYANDDDGSC